MEMKFLVFVALFTIAAGKLFKVKDAQQATCAMLEIDGSLDIDALKNGTSVGKASLVFSDASVLTDSTCTVIKLDMTKSAQLWFQFNEDKQKWSVTPISAFVPSDVIPDVNLPNGTEKFTSDPLDQPFQKTQSFICNSSIQRKFKQTTLEDDEFTYTVTATTKGLQIQSSNIKDDKFSTDTVECSADPKPVTTPRPTPTPGPTPAPGPKVQDYNCSSGNVTVLRVSGAFSLSITYTAKDAQGKDFNATAHVNVPQASSFDSSCSKNESIEYVKANFNNGWSMAFYFDKEKSEYSLANISIVYVYDNLPNATQKGSHTVDLKGADLNLKASNKGYYTCNANSSFTSEDKTLTLTSTDFKFRAFDDKGDGFKGDVSQCSADQESNSIVPIAVGAALAGLVVIVLIAYLIGRKRSRKSGYESV